MLDLRRREDSRKDVKASFAPFTVASKTSPDSSCALATSVEMFGRSTVVAKATRLETVALNVYERTVNWTVIKSNVIVAMSRKDSMVSSCGRGEGVREGWRWPFLRTGLSKVSRCPPRYLSCL